MCSSFVLTGEQMLTERIDAAYRALDAARERTPALLEVYPPDTPERVALNRVMAALHHVDDVLLGRCANPPEPWLADRDAASR